MLGSLKSFEEKFSMLVMQLEHRGLKHYKNIADESEDMKNLT